MATSWSDATITAQTTLIKPAHITEMRTAINGERNRRSLGNASFTDSSLTAGTTMGRKSHVQDICNAITSFSALSPTDATLADNSTPIRKVHVDEIRTKINALENHPTVGGTTDCNSSCSGLCVGCTGTCTGSCTSCTGCTGCTSCSSCSGSCDGGCSGCSGDACTCFPAGTRILMEDYTEKKIEDVVIGDRIIGIDGKAHNVIFLDVTKLGDNRALLEFGDGSLQWSEEHPLWVRKADGEEYWGVWGYGAYLREMEEENPHLPEEFKGFGLRKRLPDQIYRDCLEYAHVDGWKRQRVIIQRDAHSNMPLYDLGTDGPGTMIANGYVVSAFATDRKFDFSAINWEGLLK